MGQVRFGCGAGCGSGSRAQNIYTLSQLGLARRGLCGRGDNDFSSKTLLLVRHHKLIKARPKDNATQGSAIHYPSSVDPWAHLQAVILDSSESNRTKAIIQRVKLHMSCRKSGLCQLSSLQGVKLGENTYPVLHPLQTTASDVTSSQFGFFSSQFTVVCMQTCADMACSLRFPYSL